MNPPPKPPLNPHSDPDDPTELWPPDPPEFWNELEVVRCACGRGYTLRQWGRLRFCGRMDGLELRHCGCGSTISIYTTRP